MSRTFEHGHAIEIEEKAVKEDGDNYVVTGYASVFNNKDLGNDIVMPGAFAKSLRDHGMPLLLFNHKMDDAPIGTVVDAKEDKRGLWYKAELPKADSLVSGRIIPQLKNRGLKSNSIGYNPTSKEIRKSDGVRLLKELRLYEISIVNLPMNPLADIESVKGFVPYQDLFIDRNVTAWDADAVMKKLLALYGDDTEALRQHFLWVDEEKDATQWDAKLLIADVDDKKRIATNPVALYKAVATLSGAREGVELPEAAETAVKETLERYYRKLDLDAPFKSLSVDEYETLSSGELDGRLRGLGFSRKLAKQITGLRDADRKQVQRDVASNEDGKVALLNVFSELVALAAKR